MFRMSRMLFALTLLAFPALATLSGAQDPTGVLDGRIIDASSAQALRATVSLPQLKRAARADADGRYHIEAIRPGLIRVSAHLLGFADLDTTVAIIAGRSTTLDVALRPEAHALAEVRSETIRPERDQFERSPTVSAMRITGAEIARVPSLGESDVLRAVSTLPGVAARNDYTVGFNVRGGEDDQALVMLDGIPIHNPFHLGGLFGTFIPEAVSSLDLLTGAFPASYGGRLSGVLDVKSTEDARPGVHGAGDVSLLSSAAAIGGALQGGRGTWSVAARRTYADKVISAVQSTYDFPYHFQDVQLHATLQLPWSWRLATTMYAGKDLLHFEPDSSGHDGEPVLFDWGNQVAGITLTRPVLGRALFSQRVSVSRFYTHLDTPRSFVHLADALDLGHLSGDLVTSLGRHELHTGYDVERIAAAYDEQIDVSVQGNDFADPLATDGDTTLRATSGAASLFADDTWRAGRWMIRPGVRAERVGSAGWHGVSPRVAAKFFLSPTYALSAAAGRHAQWLHAVRNEDLPIKIFDIWLPSGPGIPVSTSTHVVGGAEKWLGDVHFVRVETYWKNFQNLPEPRSTIDPRIRPELLRYFGGTSYGTDVYLRRLESHGVSGWLSYGYSVSKRTRDDVSYFPAHDRRHNANAIVGYATGKWTLGTRASIASGTPYTGWSGTFLRAQYDPISGAWRVSARPSAADADQVRGLRNAQRYPVYMRSDVFAERSPVGNGVTWQPYLSILNVTNRKNVFLYQFEDGSNPPLLKGIRQLPLLPTFGLHVRF